MRKLLLFCVSIIFAGIGFSGHAAECEKAGNGVCTVSEGECLYLPGKNRYLLCEESCNNYDFFDSTQEYKLNNMRYPYGGMFDCNNGVWRVFSYGGPLTFDDGARYYFYKDYLIEDIEDNEYIYISEEDVDFTPFALSLDDVKQKYPDSNHYFTAEDIYNLAIESNRGFSSSNVNALVALTGKDIVDVVKDIVDKGKIISGLEYVRDFRIVLDGKVITKDQNFDEKTFNDFIKDVQEELNDINIDVEDLQADVKALQNDRDRLAALVEHIQESGLNEKQKEEVLDLISEKLGEYDQGLQKQFEELAGRLDDVEGDVDALKKKSEDLLNEIKKLGALTERQIKDLYEQLETKTTPDQVVELILENTKSLSAGQKNEVLSLIVEYTKSLSAGQQAQVELLIKQYVDPRYELLDTKVTLVRQQSAARDKINSAMSVLNSFASSAKVSVWKNKEGKFNTARLASDTVAGVVLGTAGGLISNHLIKKNQVEDGMEDIRCTVGGQTVAGFGDEFMVGMQ